jgi:hypothetical protein
MACAMAASFICYQNNREVYASTDASLDFLFLLYQDKRKDKIILRSCFGFAKTRSLPR